MIEPIHVWICFVVFYNFYPFFIWKKFAMRQKRPGFEYNEDRFIFYWGVINGLVLLPIGAWLFRFWGK